MVNYVPTFPLLSDKTSNHIYNPIASPEVYTPGPIYYKPHTPPLYTTNHKYKRSADQPQTVYNYPYNYNPGGSHETAYAPVQSYASPVIPAVLTTNHQSYVSPNQQPTYTPSCEYVNFDDAPEPIYGIAISTRTIYDCNDAEYADLCTKLQKEDKFVDCDNRRFRLVKFVLKFYHKNLTLGLTFKSPLNFYHT